MATPTITKTQVPPTIVKLSTALGSFVASERIVRDSTAYCKFDSFVKHFKDFCLKTNVAPLDNEAVTPQTLFDATGLTVERDTYKAYPGPHGTLQKAAWVTGMSIVADDLHGEQLSLLCDFLNQRNVFVYDVTKYMKYPDFLKCLDAYCLQKRTKNFKPSARLLKDICVRFNVALETTGIHDGVKGKYLLGMDFA